MLSCPLRDTAQPLAPGTFSLFQLEGGYTNHLSNTQEFTRRKGRPSSGGRNQLWTPSPTGRGCLRSH